MTLKYGRAWRINRDILNHEKKKLQQQVRGVIADLGESQGFWAPFTIGVLMFGVAGFIAWSLLINRLLAVGWL